MIPKEEVLERAACLLELASSESEKDRARRVNEYRDEQMSVAESLRHFLSTDLPEWRDVAKGLTTALEKRNKQAAHLRKALENLHKNSQRMLWLYGRDDSEAADLLHAALTDTEEALRQTTGWNVPPCAHERLK